MLVVRDSERLVVEGGLYTASVHAKPNGISWQSLSESTLASCHRIDILTATSRLLDNERAERSRRRRTATVRPTAADLLLRVAVITQDEYLHNAAKSGRTTRVCVCAQGDTNTQHIVAYNTNTAARIEVPRLRQD